MALSNDFQTFILPKVHRRIGSTNPTPRPDAQRICCFVPDRPYVTNCPTIYVGEVLLAGRAINISKSPVSYASTCCLSLATACARFIQICRCICWALGLVDVKSPLFENIAWSSKATLRWQICCFQYDNDWYPNQYSLETSLGVENDLRFRTRRTAKFPSNGWVWWHLRFPSPDDFRQFGTHLILLFNVGKTLLEA